MKFKSIITAIVLVLSLVVGVDAKSHTRTHIKRSSRYAKTHKTSLVPKFDAAAMLRQQQRNDRTCDGDYDQRKLLRKQ